MKKSIRIYSRVEHDKCRIFKTAALTAEGIRIEQYELNDVYVPKNNTNV